MNLLFIDVVKIKLKAGNGGNGAVSFHRDKFTSTGGPDGGNGGSGGNIVFVLDNNMSTLSSFRYKKIFVAQNGENGASGRCTGKSGQDLIIKVPPGTLIKDQTTGHIIADMSDTEPKIIAKGGKGGAGNMNFSTPVRQSPRFSKPGTFGEELEVILELKLLADVAVVGYPNVGKSTFLSVISNAKPQIANYHFTTLSPILGVVNHNDKSFVVADIPGLIEGASEGSGLGHQFLRHVERCRLLLHIVDISGSEGRNPIEDFKKINVELKKFNENLADLPMLIIGNKIDAATRKQIVDFEQFIKKEKLKFFEMSAISGKGIKKVLDCVLEMIESLPPMRRFEPEVFNIENNTDSEQKFVIVKQNNSFLVTGNWIERFVESINFDDYDSQAYFQKMIIKLGIIDEIRKLGGANEGDLIKIGEKEFEYFE